MNYQVLRTELITDPLAIGYAGKSDDEVTDLLNALSYSKIKPRFITARSMLAEIPTAAQILDKLEATATSISSVKWAMFYLKGEGGIDIGHPATIAQLDDLVTYSILTNDEATAVKNMAIQPASRAEILGLDPVNYNDVNMARA